MLRGKNSSGNVLGLACIVFNCRHRHGHMKTDLTSQDKIRYFSFPTDPKLRNFWIQKCAQPGKWNPDVCKVCSVHFRDEDFEDDDFDFLTPICKRDLKKDAIPTLNLGKNLSNLSSGSQDLKLPLKLRLKLGQDTSDHCCGPQDLKLPLKLRRKQGFVDISEPPSPIQEEETAEVVDEGVPVAGQEEEETTEASKDTDSGDDQTAGHLLNHLCRLCAKPKTDTEELIPILGDMGKQLQIEEKLIYLPIEFSPEEDRLPMQTCSRCVIELHVCHELIMRCAVADAKHREILYLEEEHSSSPVSFSEDFLSDASVHKQGSITPVPDLAELVDDDQKIAESSPVSFSEDILSGASVHKQGSITPVPDLAELVDDDQKIAESSPVSINEDILSGASVHKQGSITSAPDLAELVDDDQSLAETNAEQVESDVDTTISSMVSESHNGSILKKCSLGSCNFNTYTLNRLKEHTKKIHHKELCMTCENVFNSPEILEHHIKITHSVIKVSVLKISEVDDSGRIVTSQRNYKTHEIEYKCPNCCKTGFKDKKEYEHHLSKHVDLNIVLQCPICDKKFARGNDVMIHRRSVHGKSNFKCGDCNKTIKNKSALHAHFLMKHLLEWKYLCNVCSFKCTDLTEIYSHINNKHSNKKNRSLNKNELLLFTRTSDYKCNICKNTYANLYCLNKHKSKCTKKKVNKRLRPTNKFKKIEKCHICFEIFRGPGALGRHLRTDHKIRDKDNLSKICIEKNGTYECRKCHKKLANKDSLKVHNRYFHLKEKIHKCSECDESFYLKTELDAHENKQHKHIAPYHCTKCPKTFFGSHLLTRHMRSHTKPLACQFCSKSFAYGGQLRKHKLTHTGEKPHECLICSRGFTQKHEMERHQLTHINEKKFKCSDCGFDSNKLKDIINHIEEEHDSSDGVVVIRQDLSEV